jgi:hypothetical protein
MAVARPKERRDMGRIMLLGLAALAGCSGPYRVTATTPNSITICHDPWLRYEQSAADDAEQHCRTRNMTAVPTIRGQCGFSNVNREVTFECRARSPQT